MFSMSDLTKGKDNEVSEIFSGLFELSGIEVSINCCGISENCTPVGEYVLCDDFNKGNWVKEL